MLCHSYIMMVRKYLRSIVCRERHFTPRSPVHGMSCSQTDGFGFCLHRSLMMFEGFLTAHSFVFFLGFFWFLGFFCGEPAFPSFAVRFRKLSLWLDEVGSLLGAGRGAGVVSAGTRVVVGCELKACLNGIAASRHCASVPQYGCV